MSASFEALICSRPFKFVVGADEVPIVVHEEAFATLSPALSVLMQGKISESFTGEAIWKDIDKETFLRFAQFAYTGDYSIKPLYHDGVGQVTQKASIPESSDDEWILGVQPRKAKKLHENRDPPRFTPDQIPPHKPFRKLTYPLLDSRFKFSHNCIPVKGVGPSENIREVLLIHASLYVLAEKWGIDGLKRLTLLKLHQTLDLLLPLPAPMVPHIVQLVSYSYSDERTPDRLPVIDELRELVCQYVTANAATMTQHASFMHLVEEGGVFVRDLWKRAVPRIIH